jgi:hypothetical protein
MKRDFTQGFKERLHKLQPWQQQLVACRAAMRALPAVGGAVGASFWKEPDQSVDAIARLPWLICLSRVDLELSLDMVEASNRVYDAYKIAESTSDTSAGPAANAAFAAHAIDGAEAYSEHIKHALDAAVFSSSPRRLRLLIHVEFSASVLCDILMLSSTSAPQSREDSIELWQEFFGRPLWEPSDTSPNEWQEIVGAFRKSAARLGLRELADQYEEHCRQGADFEDIQRWLFGEVRIPLHSEDGIELTEDDVWWMQLLYRMGLEDRGRLNVLVQPRMNDVVTALADCVRSLTAEPDEARSKSTRRAAKAHRGQAATREAATRLLRRQDVVDVASRLEKQYGHLSPPPLWTAWFQAVHGDELRKIRRHLAKETR